MNNKNNNKLKIFKASKQETEVGEEGKDIRKRKREKKEKERGRSKGRMREKKEK